MQFVVSALWRCVKQTVTEGPFQREEDLATWTDAMENMISRKPNEEDSEGNELWWEWEAHSNQNDALNWNKGGWIYPADAEVHETFEAAIEQYMLDESPRTVKRTSPADPMRLDAHIIYAGLFALKPGHSENITNVQLPLSSLVEQAGVPESERMALQCLDIPDGHYNTLASGIDTIDVLEALQGCFKYRFVQNYFDSFRFWATANTAHCHSPQHIDSAGAGTACRILNRKGGKLWGLKVPLITDPDERFRAAAWTSESVPNHKGDTFDFVYFTATHEL